MKTILNLKFASTILAACVSLSASAVPIFSSNFESGLGDWEGKSGGAHSGLTVADPLASGHGSVLTFGSAVAGGDLFSKQVFTAGSYILAFDYLGMAPGSQSGGYIGTKNYYVPMSLAWGDNWLAGAPGNYAKSGLIDDGAWHSYSIAFTSLYDFKLALEDFAINKTANNAFFDNIVLSTPNVVARNSVPETGATAVLLIAGCAALVAARRFVPVTR